jgi:hypothetical protein
MGVSPGSLDGQVAGPGAEQRWVAPRSGLTTELYHSGSPLATRTVGTPAGLNRLSGSGILRTPEPRAFPQKTRLDRRIPLLASSL